MGVFQLPVLDVHAIEREAATLPVAEQASYLRDQIGREMTAYVCGLDHAPTIADWIKNPDRKPQDRALMRLTNAYIVVRMICEAFGKDTAKTWLFGSNSRLGDAPAYVLRHAESPDDLRYVVPVAKTFAGGAS